MDNFVMYHIPGQQEYICLEQTSGKPLAVSSIEELRGKDGFVFAPFQADKDCPILLLQADKRQTFPLESEQRDTFVSSENISTDDGEKDIAGRYRYVQDFKCFHQQLLAEKFKKIVLARKRKVKIDRILNEKELFLEACQRYFLQFVALVHLAQAGVWLMATPEILLEGNPLKWKTMALAGTMQAKEIIPLSSSVILQDQNALWKFWSEKNKEEQKYVTSYIKEILQPLTEDLMIEGPCTARAGDLFHLQTNFTFRLSSQADPTVLLRQLFPTPAVCGIPKEHAKAFILRHEHYSRRYYSGFAGILSSQGNTRLYVTLRCMEIKNGICELYAGSGLMPESKEDSEFQETTAKMKPMLSLISNFK